MARIRSIHPGLFTDPEFADLTEAAQIFYLGLLTEADDNGVFEWKPTTLRIRLRPTKDGAVDHLLSELVNAEKVGIYEIDGRKYGAIRNFRVWQRPKAPKSWHPISNEFRNYVGLTDETSPDGGNEETSSPPISPIPPQREDVGGRREEEKKVEERAAPRATQIPVDWAPDQKLFDYAKSKGCPDPADTFERFRLHHGSKGTKFKDWTMAAQLWCRNEHSFRRTDPEPPKSQGWN